LNGCNGSADAAELCVGADRAKSALSPADYLEKILRDYRDEQQERLQSFLYGKSNVGENTGLLPHR
jgi:hypothetical protein